MHQPMTRCTFPLLLLLAALAPPSEAAAGAVPSPPVEAVAPGDNEPAPPGSASDLALWRSGQAIGESVVGERTRAMVLQTNARGNRLLERLEEEAGRAEPTAASQLTALRQRLLQAWQRDYELLTRRWPVDPTRVCWNQRLLFDSTLRAQATPDTVALAQARGELRECIEKGQAAVQSMAAANQTLESAMKAAEAALPPLAVPTGAAK